MSALIFGLYSFMGRKPSVPRGLSLWLPFALAVSCAHRPEKAASPAELEARIHAAEKLGRIIFMTDSIAAQASDSLRAANVFAQGAGPRGWLTLQGEGDAWLVPFVQMEGGVAGVRYVVHWQRGITSLETLPAFTELQGEAKAMYQARTTALAAVQSMCGTGLNPVVLPASLVGREGWLVYVLQGTTRSGIAILGGHRGFIVSVDGQRIVEELTHSNECFVEKFEGVPSGAVPAGVFFMRMDSELPDEMWVFASLQYKLGLYVQMRTGAWKVVSGRIAPLK